ncbi:MAG: site-specific integrase [Methanoregula sp.]|nr:site-specific integrase [Methanoregula sp.]
MYTVVEYLDMMRAADRAPGTIRSYKLIFELFARFLNIPLDDLHNHLLPEHLIKYAGSLKGYSGQTVRQRLAILRAYFTENGVQFKGMEMKVLNARRHTEPEDKVLELLTLQKMMDITDERGRAFIAVMVSTGMRAGEASQLRLSDVKGDTITIPGKIAKNRHGGKVYLTTEAREYLDIWLRNRDKFIQQSIVHAGVFAKHGICPDKDPDDDRLFASGYTGLNAMFRRLYQKIDGEKGRYRGKITPHSMRKYFRTHAVKTMDLDIVEHLMRHTGYLAAEYVWISEEDIRKQFHAGEHILYLTRADQRIQGSKLDALTRENKELMERLQQVEAATTQIDQERDAIRAAGAEYVKLSDMQDIVNKAVKDALSGKK